MADYDSELAKLKKEIEISKTTGSPTNTNPLKNLDNDWETKAVEFNSLDEATKVKLIRAAAELAEIIGKKQKLKKEIIYQNTDVDFKMAKYYFTQDLKIFKATYYIQ